MAVKLQIDDELNPTAQSVKDENGKTSSLALSTKFVGIGTESPDKPLHIRAAGNGADGTSDSRIIVENGLGHKWFMNTHSSRNEFSIGRVEVADDMVIDGLGNLGIGTTNPQAKLDIDGRVQGNSAGIRVDARLNGTGPGLKILAHTRRKHDAVLVVDDNKGAPNMVIEARGNVGIGTANPREKLDVHGNIVATGDVQLSGADCAEEFRVEASSLLDPGTVMVIGDEETLHHCTKAYDRRVAGILSGAGGLKPGIVLGKQISEHKRMPLALSGKVFCNADSTYSPIETGDILTTSPTPGHAMKASDPLKAFGAVLGKALRPLNEGRGLIPILVIMH